MSTETLCAWIIDSYMETDMEEAPNDYLTLSAVSLREMEPLQAAMEDLGAVIASIQAAE